MNLLAESAPARTVPDMTTHPAPGPDFDPAAYGADYIDGRWVVLDEDAPAAWADGYTRTPRPLPFDPQMVEWGPVADAASVTDAYSWDDTTTPLRELLYTLLDALPPIERECVVHGVLENHSEREAARLVQAPTNDAPGVDRKTFKKYRDSGLARMAAMIAEPWALALLGPELPEAQRPDPVAARALFAQVLDTLGGAA